MVALSDGVVLGPAAGTGEVLVWGVSTADMALATGMGEARFNCAGSISAAACVDAGGETTFLLAACFLAFCGLTACLGAPLSLALLATLS